MNRMCGSFPITTSSKLVDKSRIKTITDRLKRVWLLHPELRLAQLIGNVYYSSVYYEEDVDFVKMIEDFYCEVNVQLKSKEEIVVKNKKWTNAEIVLVRGFAYMVKFKQISAYKAINDIIKYWIRDRSWESIRSQLNRRRKSCNEKDR